MPRIRRTVPFGSSREVTDGSRRNDRMAAIEVMGCPPSTPPPSIRPANTVSAPPVPEAVSQGGPSRTGDELLEAQDLGGALGRVLGGEVVADGGPHQRRRRPAGVDRRRGQRRDQVGYRG